MNRLSKKTVALIALGAFILLVAAAPFVAQAAQGDKDRPGFAQRQFDPDKAAERLAEVYGIDKAAILAHYNNGVKFRDIGHAAFLAKATGKSLDDVLALKTDDNKWRDVVKSLGVTREQVKATRQALAADRLNTKLGLDREATLGLLEQGYRPGDIAFAGLLADNTGKSSQEVLDMKKINNTWRDVAENLGVSKDTMRQDIQKMRQAFGRPGFHHPRHSL